ncbi:MAG: hypothetical protein KDC87_08785, partial [Planctomycetes bacterium]|nr:hypothetical protein [Planctomycetota bacterium]
MTRTGASLRTLCLVAVLATPFSSCGGGGGGGALNLAPTLIAVTFVGAGSVPVAGDRLRLVLSEPAAVAGTVLDDADLVLSAGASLGSVSGVPVVVSPHVVELVLGTGVALSPGVSTLDFGSANDAVTDAQGLKAIASAPRTLRKADAQVPVISNLTLSGVDSLLNGTGTAGGTLQVGHNRFSFDVTSSDGSSAIDTTSTLISVSVPVTRNGVTIAAGHNLTGDLTVASSPGLDQFSVPASMTLSSGAVTVTVRVVDASGQVSDPKTFAFQVRFRSSDVELFESGQVWFLDTSRDVEQFSVSLANPTTPVMVVSGANGRSDFEDLLLVLGLLSTTPIANVSGALDSNQVFLDMLRTKVVEQTTALFPGIGITFTFTAPGTFPAQSSSVSYGSFSFSQICLAGSVDTTGTSGVLGLAIFDE